MATTCCWKVTRVLIAIDAALMVIAQIYNIVIAIQNADLVSQIAESIFSRLFPWILTLLAFVFVALNITLLITRNRKYAWGSLIALCIHIAGSIIMLSLYPSIINLRGEERNYFLGYNGILMNLVSAIVMFFIYGIPAAIWLNKCKGKMDDQDKASDEEEEKEEKGEQPPTDEPKP